MGAGPRPALGGDGSILATAVEATDEHGWFLGPVEVFVEAIDTDRDTLPDAWERRFGFDPADPPSRRALRSQQPVPDISPGSSR